MFEVGNVTSISTKTDSMVFEINLEKVERKVPPQRTFQALRVSKRSRTTNLVAWSSFIQKSFLVRPSSASTKVYGTTQDIRDRADEQSNPGGVTREDNSLAVFNAQVKARFMSS